MNPRQSQRDALGLTQAEAALRAGVSFATWRRWEEDPSKVGAATRAKCDRVLLDPKAALQAALAARASNFEQAWGDSDCLTPRQAASIAATLDWWYDEEIGGWLQNPREGPLHEVMPFNYLDLRVMMRVNESQAWAASARKRCEAVAAELERGVLPFDRPGCYFDELLMALALPQAEAQLSDMPEMFEDIAARAATDGEDEGLCDDDWSEVGDAFDDNCRWDEWKLPLYTGHPLLPAVLLQRHPYSWFDPGEGTGPGYLQRLSGLVVDN